MARLVFLRHHAVGDRLTQVADTDQLIYRHEQRPLVDCADDALQQHLDREGLEHVIGRRQFRRADYLAIHTLRGQHDEDGPGADQLMVTQIFQQLLAVLAVVAGAAAQVVLAQHNVVTLLGDLTYRRAGADRIVDAVDTGLVQHIAQAGAHAGIRVHQEDR